MHLPANLVVDMLAPVSSVEDADEADPVLRSEGCHRWISFHVPSTRVYQRRVSAVAYLTVQLSRTGNKR